MHFLFIMDHICSLKYVSFSTLTFNLYETCNRPGILHLVSTSRFRFSGIFPWFTEPAVLVTVAIIIDSFCHHLLTLMSFQTCTTFFFGTLLGENIYIFKHLYLCVFQRKSYRFGMTWVWFIFGWTIPLITGWINVLLSFKCFIGIRTLDISSVHMRVITQKQHLKSKTKSPDILLYPIRRNCSVYYCRKSGNQWWEIRAASGCTVQ